MAVKPAGTPAKAQRRGELGLRCPDRKTASPAKQRGGQGRKGGQSTQNTRPSNAAERMDGDKAPGETARAEVSGSEEDLCCLQAFQDRDSGWAKVPPGPGFEGSSWHWNIISHVPMTTERAHHLSPQIGRREWAHGGAQPELKAQVNDHDVPMNSKEDTLTLQLTLLFWNALSLCPTAVGASREKAGVRSGTRASAFAWQIRQEVGGCRSQAAREAK